MLLLSGSSSAAPPLQWLDTELGAREAAAPLVRKSADGTRVELARNGGFRLERGGTEVGLRTLGVNGAGVWKRHSGGVSRDTAFGAETIVANSARTEIYLRVEERQGLRTWRWRLGTKTTPALLSDGSVSIGTGVAIDPFAVFRDGRKDVTPAGAAWQLDRDAAGWILSARFDDRGLDLPYVIDPGIANSAPAPYRQRVMTDDDGAGTDKEPIGYWRLGETSGTTALNQVSGGAGGNGTYNCLGTGCAAPTLDQTPAINDSDRSVLFNQSASGVGSRVALGSIKTPKTIEAWIVFGPPNPTVPGSRPVFSNRGAAATNNTIFFGVNGGAIAAFPLGGTAPGLQSPASSYADGQPHHIAYTWDGADAASASGTQRLYVDGVQVNSNTRVLASTGGLATVAANIGGDIQATDSFFTGRIDEVAIWDDALTATEIQAHYERGRDFGLTIAESTANQSVRTLPAPTATYSSSNASQRPTLFYRPSAAASESFTVSLPTGFVDPEDGIASFDAAAATGANDPAADTTADYSATYTWSSPPGTGQNVNAVITNSSAGPQTSTGLFTLTPDATAPNGAVALNVNGTAASAVGTTSFDLGNDGTFPIGTRTDFTEAASATASGLASSTLVRTSAPLSGNVCGTFATPVTVTGTTTQNAAEGIVTGNCYRYTLTGTDNVGNSDVRITTVKVDTSVPTADVDTVTEGTNPGAQHFDSPSQTHYFRPGGSGDFTVRATATDAESSILNVAFPSLAAVPGWTGAGGTDASSTYDSTTYAWSAGATAPGARTVTATNNASNTGTDTITIAADSSAPSGGAVTVNGVAASGGGTQSYDDDGSFPVDSRTDYDDAGSGLASSTLTRANGTLAGDACTGFGAPSNLGAGTPAQSGLATGCYLYTLTGTDNVGNAVSISTIVKVDTSNPGVGTDTVTEGTSPGSQYFDSATKTHYFRPGGSGDFTVRATASDADSGILNIAFPDLSAVASWTGTGGTDASSPYDSTTYAWSAGATAPGVRTITATNNATRTSTDTITIAADSAGPTGGSATFTGLVGTGSAYRTTTTIPVVLDNGTDAGSGINASTESLQREEATLSSAGTANGTCASFLPDGAATVDPALSFTDSTSIETGKCYRYAYTVTDNVGNTTTFTSAAVKIDISAPLVALATVNEVSGAGDQFYNGGGTHFFRPTGAGSFTIDATSSDPESGTNSVTFPGSFGTNWTGASATDATATGTTYTSPSTYAWSSGAADPTEPLDISAVNHAAASATAGITITPDSTAPASGSVSVADYDSDGTVAVAKTDYADSGSGIGSQTLTRASATLSGDACTGGFGSESAVTITAGNDADTLTNGCYRYTLTATDNVGNVSTTSDTIKVDTSAPAAPGVTLAENPNDPDQHASGTTLFFRPGGAGDFRVTATATDADTGIKHLTFPAIANVAGGGNDTSSPYQGDYTWSASTGAGDGGAKNVTATNNADGIGTATTFNFTADSTAPGTTTVTVPADGATVSGTAQPVTATTSDGGSGIASVELKACAGAGACSFGAATITIGTDTDPAGGFSVNWNTTTVADGAYRIVARATDNVGNTTDSAADHDVTIANAPQVDVDTVIEGTSPGAQHFDSPSETHYYRPGAAGDFTVRATATDPDPIANVAFPSLAGVSGWTGTGGTDTTAPYESTTYAWSSGAAAPGARTITATDTNASTGTDTITITADSTAPAGGAVTVNGVAASGGGTQSYDADGGFPVDSRTDYNDAGSGLASSTLVRESATFTAPDTCDTFGSPATVTGTTAQSGLATGCYRFTLTGTDNVGNTVSISTIVKVDTSAPAAPSQVVTETTADPDQHASGSTLFYRPGQNGGSFRVTSTATDAASGIKHLTFPAIANVTGGGGNDSSSPYEGDYSWSSSTLAGDGGSKNVTATNNADLTGPAGTFAFTADSAGPTGGSATFTGLAGTGPSYRTTTTIPVVLANGTDAGSGINASTESLQREEATLTSTGTADGTCGTFAADGAPSVDPALSFTDSTSIETGKCYRYVYTVTDNVGNATPFTSAAVKIDTSAPSVALGTVNEGTNPDDQFYNGGGTHFFRPSGSGAFTVDATSSDGEAGTNSVTFPSLSATTGWTGNGDTDSSATGITYSSTTYSWSAGAADPTEPLDMSAISHAALAATAGITISADASAPSGTAVACNGGACAGTFGSSVSVSLAGSTDGESGVRHIRYTTDGTTPTAAAGTIYAGPFTVSATTTVKFRAIDNVSNEETLGSQTISVDTTAPTLSAATTGGTATLTLTFDEALVSSATPGSAFVLSRSGSTSIAGTGTVSISGATITVTLASAPPPGQSGWTLAYAKPGAAGDRLRDAVGNEVDPITAFPVATGADSTPPETTIGAGPSGSVSSTSADFSFSSNETGSTFECKLDTGAFAACTSPKSYTALAVGTHTFEVRATDPASNVDPTPATRTWTVDTTAPTTSVGSGPAEGSSTSSTSASFGFTADEAGTTFECKLDGGAFAPCTTPKSYTGLAVGSHTFQVRSTDAAGNVGAAATRTWTVTGGPAPDTTAPTTTIDSGPSGSTTATGATFAFSANESATFECRLDGAAFAACTSPKSYTGLAVGSHTFEVRGTDASANTGAAASRTWTITAPVSGDAAPELASSTPADGATVSSISSLTLTASEPVTWSSVSVTHENGTVTPLAGSVTATTSITRAFGPSAQGLHTIRATLGDGVNAGVPVTAHFTIWVGSPGADAPPSEINAGGNESFEVTASNGIASVEVPAGATSDSIVLRIDPSPSTTAASGFSIGSDRLEVTARRTSDGSPVTTFTQPLDIEFPNASTDAIPQRSQDGGAYSPIMLTFSHDLPATRDDAYFRDASGTVHILTRHLTFFSLFRDIANPTAPRSLVGVVAGDGLTLRWEPATDNSEITGYVLLVDGAVTQVFGAQTFEAKLGLFTAGDTRTFSIQARDAAGRLGPTTGGVRGVPSLIGLTLEQATAALAARGFALGSVSSGPGAAATTTISGQTPSAPGTGSVGSTVNVVVGAVPGQARLVLKVASPKRISLADRKWIGVRVTVSARSTVAGELVSSNGRVVQRYAARSVPSGASTLRFALPAGKITATDRYRLQLRATASGQSAARTARVQIVPGVLKARFTPAKKPIGVAVIDGSIKGLNLGSSFRINYVEPSLAFDVVGLHPAFIEAAVIDVTVVPKGFIRSLRQVFPELRILALAPTSAGAAQARTEGASIALVKPVPTSRIAALLRRTLGR